MPTQQYVEENTATRNVGKSHWHNTEQKEPETKEDRLCGFIYVIRG